MSKKTYQIADAILDTAIKEYREYNLESVENVQAYTENGMGIYIDDEEAEIILNECRKFVSVEDTNGDTARAWRDMEEMLRAYGEE